jgi:hypothetical protein
MMNSTPLSKKTRVCVVFERCVERNDARQTLSLSLSLFAVVKMRRRARARVYRGFFFFIARFYGAIQVSRRRIFEVVLPFFVRALRLLGREEKQTEDENIKRPISLPRRR